MTVTIVDGCLLGGLGALAFVAPAHADETAALPDETIIVTGTKTSGEFGGKSGIPLEDVPQSVQLFTSDDLAERGITSIGDILRAVPSGNFGNSRVSRYQSFSLKIRGFLADQMRNGIRQRYYEDVDASALSNIERIEVLKGPSAVLYGQSAVGGIISIITKAPQNDFGLAASASVGRFDQMVANADLNLPLGDNAGIRATGEIERSGTFVDFQDIDRDNIALNFAWSPAEDIKAYFVGEYVQRRTRSNPGLPVVGTVVDNGVAPIPRSRFLAEPAFSDLKADSPLLQAWAEVGIGGGWTLIPRLQYSELNTPFTEVRIRGVDAADPTQVIRSGRIGSEDDSYTIAQLDLTGRLMTGAVAHEILLGYEYDRERSTFVQSNYVGVPSIDALNPIYLLPSQEPATVFAFNFRQRLDSHAVYLQDQIRIGDRLGLVLGIRHSWIENDGFFSSDPDDLGSPDIENVQQTSVQAGLTYKLGGGFSVYGGYNTGYDVENSFGGAPTVSGDRLDPETSEQFEAGVRYGSDALRFSLAAFQISRSDVAGEDPDNPGFSRALGSLRVRGLELEGQWAASTWLTLTGGYAYLDDEIRNSPVASEIGGRIADVAHHSGNVRAVVRIPGTPFDVRGGLAYMGKRAVANGSDVLLDDVLLADAAVGAQLGRIRLDLIGSNLFDERYFTVAGAHQGNRNAVYPGDPFTWTLRAGVGF